MADGRVVIRVDANTEDVDRLAKSLNKAENSGSKFGDTIKKAGLGSAVFKGIDIAIQAITASLDQAISRFDTLNQYPKVLQMMGVSADASERSIRTLTKGIEGLPTRLDEVAQTSQGLYNMTGNIDEATDLTLALNDAFLASGSSTADASRGMQQYTQMLATGEVDMQSWRTLQETMSYALSETAKQLGITSGSTSELYKALQSGEITMQDFSKAIIEMDQVAGGFADMARENSKGIATSWQNIKTAIVNGVTGIIQAFDDLLVNITGKGIAEHMDSLKEVIRAFFNTVANGIRMAEPLLRVIIGAIDGLLKIAKELSPILTSLLTAFLAYKGITAILGPLGSLGNIFKKVAENGLQAGISATGLGSSLGGLLGKINPVVLALGGLVGVGAYLLEKIHGLDDEAKELIATSNDMTTELTALADSNNKMYSGWDSNIKAIDSTKESMRLLADETVTLAENQSRTAGDTKKFKEGIEELNGYLGEEIVLYNEQSDAINISRGELEQYMEVAYQQEYLNELNREKAELQEKQTVIADELTESQEKLWALEQEMADTVPAFRGEIEEAYNSQLEEHNRLAEQYQLNVDEMNNKDVQRQSVQESLAQEEQRLFEEKQARIESGKVLMTDLSEHEQGVIEQAKTNYQGLTEEMTNMFSKLNTESELTVQDMLENLQHNQEAVSDWSENLESLTDRGVNEGMLEILREMGPQGAGYVAELATMSDEEMEEFNKIFEETPELAFDNFASAWDVEKEVVPQGIKDLITETDATFSEEMEAIDWSQYGKDVTEGFVTGIDGSKEKVSSEMEGLANDSVAKPFSSELGIKSPSTVFKEFGINLIQGLVNGINSKVNSVTVAMNKVVRTVKDRARAMSDGTRDAFINLPNQLYSAGVNAGNGFRNGLASQSGRIRATARSIANSVSNTISSALEIRSPSRKLFRYGSDSGKGFDLGLEKWVDKVKDTASELVNFDLPTFQASDVFNIARDGGNASTVNNTTNNSNTTTHRPVTVQFTGEINWSGKDDIRKTMEEVGFITEQQDWRLA